MPHLIVTLSPGGAAEARAAGSPVMLGDYTRQPILERAGVAAARMLVVADDDEPMAVRVVAVARALAPAIAIVARVDTEADAADVRRSGADLTVVSATVAEHHLIAAVTTHGRENLMSGSGALLELRAAAFESSCAHVQLVGPVRARADGCEECLRLGDGWVHLRGCMTCGHVGCCDDSKNRHATRHYHATTHPISRSMERGEDWAWCYVDEVVL
jgi:CPA2 family monovalent cation:H+ antiporter-2